MYGTSQLKITDSIYKHIKNTLTIMDVNQIINIMFHSKIIYAVESLN